MINRSLYPDNKKLNGINVNQRFMSLILSKYTLYIFRGILSKQVLKSDEISKCTGHYKIVKRKFNDK